MNFSVVAPVSDKRESKRPQVYTIYQFSNGASKKQITAPDIPSGEEGDVDADVPESPGIPVPPRTFGRVKRMARRLVDGDDDGHAAPLAMPVATAGVQVAPLATAGVQVAPLATPGVQAAPLAMPVDTAGVQAAPLATAGVQVAATGAQAALPMAVAVEYIPRNADNAAMYMEVDRMDARFKALEKRLVELEETNVILKSNEAVYQVAYGQVEARLKEKDEKHAELMRAQEEISRLKEEKYLAIIAENSGRFMELLQEKEDKFNEVVTVNYEAIRAKDETIEILRAAKRPRQ